MAKNEVVGGWSEKAVSKLLLASRFAQLDDEVKEALAEAVRVTAAHKAWAYARATAGLEVAGACGQMMGRLKEAVSLLNRHMIEVNAIAMMKDESSLDPCAVEIDALARGGSASAANSNAGECGESVMRSEQEADQEDLEFAEAGQVSEQVQQQLF